MNKRILITCGPTWVAVDGVRVLSNTSTGKLGQTLAQKLNRKGARVTLLEGSVENPLPKSKIRIVKFRMLEELSKALKHELRKPWDVVIHAVAVADYRPKSKTAGKLSSSRRSLTLKLVRTPKLINTIKRINRKTFLVGFKLDPTVTRNNAAAKAHYLFKNAGCDLVVANKIAGKKYTAHLVSPEGKITATATSRSGLATQLIKHIR